MIRILTAVLALALASLCATAEERVSATLYKNPHCACVRSTPITCDQTASTSPSSRSPT